MASSNRHWPSMFKSKPCNHHDFNSPHYASSACKSIPFPPSSDGLTKTTPEVERTPEPKPRWNPKPEQIRILEAIFNSGMVNPPREEIKKIRAQLQEYGQVGDANVFYWFQNRKSRSKQKNRQLHHHKTTAAARQVPLPAPVAPTSSTSSSDRSSPIGNNNKPPVPEISNFTQSNDPYLHMDALAPAAALPFFFPVQQSGAAPASGLCFNEFTASGGGFHNFSSEVVHPVPTEGPMGTFSALLFGDMMGGGGPPRRSMFEDEEKMRFESEEMNFLVTNPNNTTAIVPPTSPTLPMLSSFSPLQGAGEPGGGGLGRQLMGPAAKSTVFINDMSFEVSAVGPFNVREAFGDDLVLLHQSGHPVATNEWGLTVHPLQHGASYFLARTLATKHDAIPHHHLPSESPFQL